MSYWIDKIDQRIVIFDLKIVKIDLLKYENFSYYALVKFDHFAFAVKCFAYERISNWISLR